MRRSTRLTRSGLLCLAGTIVWLSALAGSESAADSGLAEPVKKFRGVVRSRDIKTFSEAALALRRWMIQNDPHQPIYHFTGPEGWINDPNGPIHYQGKYHLFYQFDPMVPGGNGGWRRSARCWGHAVSEDLVHWKDLPVALWPDTPYDRGGVYSGNTFVDEDGRLCGLYTGNVRGHAETYGMLARSADGGLTWQKTMVMDNSQRPNPHSPVHWDGFVWKEGHKWCQLIGGATGGKDRQGAAWLWTSKDLEHWTLQKNIAPAIKRGSYWELPYLVPLRGRHVLLVGQGNPYWVGTYDKETMTFVPDGLKPNSIDNGTYYSFNPNMTDDKGPDGSTRRIVHGWVTGPPTPTKTVPYWQGAHSIPRVLSLRGRHVVQQPIPEIEALRGKRQQRSDIRIEPDSTGHLPDIKGDALEIIAKFDPTTSAAAKFGVKVRVAPDGKEFVRVWYEPKTDHFGTDGSVQRKVSAPRGFANRASPPKPDERTVTLRIFVDRSILEVYCDGAALTNRMFLDRKSVSVDLFAEGGSVRLESLHVWPMRSMWSE